MLRCGNKQSRGSSPDCWQSSCNGGSHFVLALGDSHALLIRVCKRCSVRAWILRNLISMVRATQAQATGGGKLAGI